MGNFIRRFTSDPGIDVLIEIESVNILDLDPPASITGVGSGKAMIVGEFENGPFGTPTEVTGADDLKNTFGSFGYTYNGTLAQNPCARSRKADGAINAEYWNGNGMVQLSGKRFSSLVIVRVDTSVGSVTFSRQASVKGTSKPSYVVANGATLSFDVGAGAVSATFTAATAVMTGAAATFAITGGESVTIAYDTNSQAGVFTATFLSTDTTVAAVVNRINQYAGFTFASVSGGQVRLTGRQLGSGGKVQVLSFDAGGTAAKLGLAVSSQAGTGNVADSNAVAFAELKTIVEAAVAGVKIDQSSDFSPRASFVTTPLTGTIAVASPSTATDFGFVIGAAGNAATGTAAEIPAGTIVKTAGGVKYVVMQDVAVSATVAGPYAVKVRHATDDGTGTASLTGTVNLVDSLTPVDFDSFAVINLLPTTVALTEPQIDAQYVAAFDTTLDINSVSKEVNIAWSARQSNATRRKVRDNVTNASASGCFGRVGCIRPPLGTAKAIAQGNAEPGVGPYRDQRVIYNYPGVATSVPIMARVGLAGGVGFTATGIVDVGADGFCASVMSQLAPEENPGQDAGLLGNVISVESAANAQGFNMGDYKNFRAKGICAVRFDAGTASFQSGVTSVDPAIFPNLRNIARRRMADFIQDTLANRLRGFGKKISTVRRRKAITSEIRAFLNTLLSAENNADQRIAAFAVDSKTGNTAETLGLGLYRVKVYVTTLASLDSIVIQTTIGEQVDVTELAA